MLKGMKAIYSWGGMLTFSMFIKLFINISYLSLNIFMYLLAFILETNFGLKK